MKRASKIATQLAAQQHDMRSGMQIGFERIPHETIDQLIAEGTVFCCAGGLMVEHPLVEPCITYMHGVCPRAWVCCPHTA